MAASTQISFRYPLSTKPKKHEQDNLARYLSALSKKDFDMVFMLALAFRTLREQGLAAETTLPRKRRSSRS